MTLYFIDSGGSASLSADHFSRCDRSLAQERPSFEDRIPITRECFKRLFLGEDNPAYDYLLNSGLEFAIATHPRVTFSCQDKIDMYNELGCSVDGSMNGSRWELEDTIKAIYFGNKKTKKYLIAVIPGQPAGTYIDQRKSFMKLCQDRLEMSRKEFKTDFVLFPAKRKLAFGIGQEGCLSPLIPFYGVKDGRTIVQSKSMVDAIYFDGRHLDRYYETNSSKLDDLSIAMCKVGCKGFIEKTICADYASLLKESVDGEEVPLQLESDESCFAYVKHPLIGEYRDKTASAVGDGDEVMLRFDHVPNHMLSMLMSYRSVYELLEATFPGLVHSVDIEYYTHRRQK